MEIQQTSEEYLLICLHPNVKETSFLLYSLSQQKKMCVHITLIYYLHDYLKVIMFFPWEAENRNSSTIRPKVSDIPIST